MIIIIVNFYKINIIKIQLLYDLRKHKGLLCDNI